MLDKSELKDWLHRKGISRRDKLLLALATFDFPCSIREIMARCAESGLRVQTSWNPSQLLSQSKGLAIRLPGGWEISKNGKQYLKSIGVSKISPSAVQVATDLRSFLNKISNENVRDYAEEAIRCYENDLYRSAIVLSWVAAIAVLHTYVVQNHLSSFNSEAQRIDPKWKTAKNEDDLGAMKEYDFLNRLTAISMVGKNSKEELHKALKTRNACGHPNSFKIAANATAAHLEILLLNVFNKYQI